jgi:hypothetical protein
VNRPNGQNIGMLISVLFFNAWLTMLTSEISIKWLHVNSQWLIVKSTCLQHGSLNVPIEHHPTIRYMVYNGYYKVMSNIPKMGQLPTPVQVNPFFHCEIPTSAAPLPSSAPCRHQHRSPPLSSPGYLTSKKLGFFRGINQPSC